MGIKLPTKSSRAAMAIVMGTAGFLVAVIGIDNIGSYENFLLVIAYWIGPWLGVVFADRVLRRFRVGEWSPSMPKYRNWAGSDRHAGRRGGVDLAVLQPGAVHRHRCRAALPAIGDITFEVGFLLAFGIYALLYGRWPARSRRATPPAESVRGAALTAGARRWAASRRST